MKKSILFSIVTILILPFLVASCVFDETIKSDLEFLEKNYSGTFTNRRVIKSHPRLSKYDLEYYSYAKFFSSALNQDIIVRADLDEIGFASNYLYLKYSAEDQSLAEYIKEFSNKKIIYDVEFCFSYSSEKDVTASDFIDKKLIFQPAYIVIAPDENEYANLEKRLHACVERFNQNENSTYSRHFYFYILKQDSEFAGTDVSKLTYSDLQKDGELYNEFEKYDYYTLNGIVKKFGEENQSESSED